MVQRTFREPDGSRLRGREGGLFLSMLGGQEMHMNTAASE